MSDAAPPPIRIAWMIHAYRNPELVVRLVESVRRPGDTVWIHYDRKSPSSDVDALRGRLGGIEGVDIHQRFRTYWGGIEIVDCDVFLCDKLLESGAAYDFVIHLTGTTFPIKPSDQLRTFLALNRQRSFLRTEPLGHLLERETASAGPSGAPQPAEDADRLHFAREHFGLWRNRPYSAARNPPGLNVQIRRLQYAASLLSSRVASKVSRLFGRPSRDVVLPRTFPRIHRGFVHDMIARPHFEAVHRSAQRKAFLAELRNVSCPDEVFYHTTLRALVPADELVNEHYLYTSWTGGRASPDEITLDRVDALVGLDAFFARKVERLEVAEAIESRLLRA